MKITKLQFTGFNGFGQFKSCTNCNFVQNVTDIDIDNLISDNVTNKSISKFDIKCCYEYTAIAVDKNLYLTGYVKGVWNSRKKFELPDLINTIACNDTICLILLETKELYKISITRLTIDKVVNFLDVEEPISTKLSITKHSLTDRIPEQIELIAVGHTLTIAVSNKSSVYNIPSKIGTFERHIRFVKVCCGAEHVLSLTSNGDVYTWGVSSRGQSGNGTLNTIETPTLLEALAGVKILDIAAGTWHSAAVSAFNDLYIWGWNVNGQMGCRTSEMRKVTYTNGDFEWVKHKLPSVFSSPEIINLPKNESESSDDDLMNQWSIKNVYCGARHTIVRTIDNKFLASGFNAYGQLGIGESEREITKFQIIDGIDVGSDSVDVVCGHWSTIFIHRSNN